MPNRFFTILATKRPYLFMHFYPIRCNTWANKTRLQTPVIDESTRGNLEASSAAEKQGCITPTPARQRSSFGSAGGHRLYNEVNDDVVVEGVRSEKFFTAVDAVEPTALHFSNVGVAGAVGTGRFTGQAPTL
jgi:hypothetical protein